MMWTENCTLRSLYREEYDISTYTIQYMKGATSDV